MLFLFETKGDWFKCYFFSVENNVIESVYPLKYIVQKQQVHSVCKKVT